MNLEWLRSYLSVARLRNFTKAADELHMTPSALSKHVAALETELGIRLLERSTRFVEPTEAGRTVLSSGERIMSEFGDMSRRLEELHHGITGTLKLVSQIFYSEGLFSAHSEFRRRCPNIAFSTEILNSPGIPAVMAAGQADLGIMHSFWLEPEPQFELLRLYSERLMLMVSEKHPFAKRGRIHYTELRDQRVIYIPDASAGYFEKLIMASGAEHPLPNEHLLPKTAYGLALQVKDSDDVTFVDSTIAHESSYGCRTVQVEGLKGLDYDVVALWRRDSENPALPLFLEILRRNFPAAV